jgi:hypothetical protein
MKETCFTPISIFRSEYKSVRRRRVSDTRRANDLLLAVERGVINILALVADVKIKTLLSEFPWLRAARNNGKGLRP